MAGRINQQVELLPVTRFSYSEPRAVANSPVALRFPKQIFSIAHRCVGLVRHGYWLVCITPNPDTFAEGVNVAKWHVSKFQFTHAKMPGIQVEEFARLRVACAG